MHLINAETLKFNRGKHAGETLWEVTEDDIEYLLWLVGKSDISDADREVLENCPLLSTNSGRWLIFMDALLLLSSCVECLSGGILKR